MVFNQLGNVVQKLKAKADVIETETILQVSEQIQMLIGECEVPQDLAQIILDAYGELDAATPADQCPLKVSLRSSAIGEDVLSFADTRFQPPPEILDEYKNILASLFTPRAIAYRLHMGIPFSDAAMAVACHST